MQLQLTINVLYQPAYGRWHWRVGYPCTAKPEPAPPPPSLPRIGDKPPLEGWPRHR